MILKFWVFSIVLSIFLNHRLIKSVHAQAPHRRFEYKYSFKPPYLAQKDSTIPFFEFGGNAIASSENVRLAPSLRSQKGAVWTKSRTNFDWWEIDVVFRISGRGRVGADGLAIWFTSEKGDYNGEVFGASDKWNGLGLFFDSFDNDNKHNNPYIMAVLNDGSISFDHQNDGGTQNLAGCLRDFRNKPFPTRAKIEYYNNVLTVLFHNGMSNNEHEYEVCLRAENVHLPKFGYFGVSAATGGLADDHDVYHFLTTSLHAPGTMDQNTQQAGSQLTETERLSQEYLDYQKKLDQHKEDYRKDHPEENKEDSMDDWFESDNQRELRQIWQAQSTTTEVLRELSKKLDEVVGRQERTLGLLSANAHQIQTGAPQAGHVPPPASGQQPYVDTIRRHEVDALMNNQNILTSTVREIRTSLGDLQQRIEYVAQNTKAPGAGVASNDYAMNTLMGEMRDGMNHVKNQIQAVQAKMASPLPQTACPNIPCLGLTQFLIAVVVQLVILLGYNIYRDSKDAQAKKFY